MKGQISGQEKKGDGREGWEERGERGRIYKNELVVFCFKFQFDQYILSCIGLTKTLLFGPNSEICSFPISDKFGI